MIAPVFVSYDSKEEVELHILPTAPKTVRFAPYPFDISPLKVTVRARLLAPRKFASQEEGLEAYHKAPRQLLSFDIVD